MAKPVATLRSINGGHSLWPFSQAGPGPVVVADVASDQALATDPALATERDALLAEGIASLAVVPLTLAGRLIGQSVMYRNEVHVFDNAELRLAQAIANHVALALQRQRSLEDLERNKSQLALALDAGVETEHAARLKAEALAARLASLQLVTAELSRAVSLEEVVDVVLGTALRELGATNGSLCLLDGEELELAYAVGYPETVTGHWGRFPLSADLPASEAVRTGQAIYFSTAQERDLRYPVFGSTPVVGDAAFATIPLAEKAPPGCLVLGFSEPRDFTQEEKSLLFMLASRCGVALERAQLFEERQRAVEAEALSRQSAEQAWARVAFLSEASALLASSLDYQLTLTQLAELAVPRLADWCGIYLSADGEITPVAVSHVDPAKVRLARELLERFPVRPSDANGIAEVIRSGVPQVYPEITEELLTASPISQEQLHLVRSVGFGSGMVMPLQARGRIFGALSLANDQGRALQPDDAFLAEELAARASISIDNARLYEDRAYVARTLQQSLLPPKLPEIWGLEIAGQYRPASDDVGGDFYDVFQLPSQRWLLAIGDVCGKGPAAAVLTGLIRSALRAVASHESEPSAILAAVNDAILSQSEDSKLFTMVVAIIDASEQPVHLSVGCAGHPVPIVVRADGRIEPGGRAGTLLGVFADPSLTDHPLNLSPGDAVVFFTDGATNQRVASEVSALVEALQAQAGSSASALVDAALEVAQREQTRDDVAILALRVPA